MPGTTTDRRGPAAARVVDAVKVHGAGDTAVRALDGVTVGFPAGRFTAIMGPSGSGKSTLLHCAAGLDALTSGAAFVGGTELGPLGDRQLTLLRRERIGFVFQSFNLVPTLDVAENVTLPLDLAGTRPDAEWIDALIDVVGLRDRLRHRPAELSGGQQQRVAVARARAGRPEVVFADEPTGNLDSRTGGEVLELLGRAVRDMGRTVVMVTHDPPPGPYGHGGAPSRRARRRGGLPRRRPPRRHHGRPHRPEGAGPDEGIRRPPCRGR